MIEEVINPFESTVKPFCDCNFPTTLRDDIHEIVTCKCGEDIISDDLQWEWDSAGSESYVNGKNITFHPTYSSGTAVVRGKSALKKGMIHYWEIRVLTQLSGTDQMFGVGTNEVNLTEFNYTYTSALGLNGNSWAFSYRGFKQHNGESSIYGNKINQGCIVGVLLDLSLGYIEFFINRRSLGIAYRNIPTDKSLYPMVCSTASKSSIRLITSLSFEDSLIYRSYETIVKNGLLKSLQILPGLEHLLLRYWYLNPPPRYSSQTNSNELSIEDEIILLKKMSKRQKIEKIEEHADSEEEFDLYKNAFIEPVKDKTIEDSEEEIYHFLL
ncbi:SPSB3 family protein [Megaselia abdita]